MTAKTMLVTGATDGIGKQTALNLARSGARVFVHGRDGARTAAAVEQIRAASANAEVEPALGDFGDLESLRLMAEELRGRTSRLDVVVHNAGTYRKTRELTKDGFEATFQVNHLAPFLLNALLLDLVLEAPAGRVVVVSSMVHRQGRVDFGDLQSARSYDGYRAYADSKLMNALFAVELARRLEGTHATCNYLHPGVISTKLLHEGFGPGGASVAKGAETSTRLALDPDLEGVSGRYFVDGEPAEPNPLVRDPALRKRLWEVSEGLAGL